MRPGEIVNERFEIVRSAGCGGMGVVYQAHDRKAECSVALKILVEREQGLTDRFAQEVEVLSALEHPHIVGYVSHGITGDGAPYLVMPWLEGQDLQQRLDTGPLSVDETLIVAHCVADALAYLHGRALVHRDLKPSNLFLPKGQLDKLQIIDLGIARGTVPTRPLTLSGVLLGTPGFMAPEQARGDYEVAPAADIFSLGCVLFECLTGKRLFGGAHVMAVLAKILVEEPPRVRELRPDVPDAIDLLVHRMVSKEPERRPRDGAELGQWLEDMRRAPPGSLRSLPPPSLTAVEQRVVTVLVVVLAVPREPWSTADDVTRAEVDPFRASSARFGVRVQSLDGRTAIAFAPPGFNAADQASVLARFGRYVADTFPGASVALATGSAVTGVRLPVGEAIDRGVTIVRGATPGQGVHVDDTTAALITSRFDLRREGGRFLLEDERVSLDPTRPLLGRPTSCVGRDREFAILGATFAECIEGAGPKVVLVTAAAGAGKSRLRHEFVRRLRSFSGVSPRVLQGRGGPLHLATPYAQIAQVVRQAAQLGDREPPEIVRAKLMAHVAELVSASESTRVTDFLGELVGARFKNDDHVALRAARHSAEAMSDQIRLAFEELLRAWCRKHPVILVLEDLHWGDAASVRILDGALRKLAGDAFFVLALARPEVHERFPGLWKNRDLTEIRLPPLPTRACMRLVREVIGDAASADDVRRIVERSEGNAFYLEELIRDAYVRDWRMSSRPPPTRSDFPETIIAVAQTRLERLEPSVRKVLRAASVFGEVFPVEGVSALVGEKLSTLEPIFGALVEHEALVLSDQPRLAGVRELVFRHGLLRGAAYATLTDGDRALGHRLAAQWLEGVGEDREVAALHWLEGGERGRAAACFEHAAELRWARAQAETAARCAVRSLLVGDSVSESPHTISARIRLLADALEATRRIDARDVMTGLEHHLTLPEHPPEGSAKDSLVHLALDRSLDALRAAADPSTVADALARAGCALGALSDFKGAKRLLVEATALAADNETRLQSVRYTTAKVAFWACDWGSAVETLSGTLLPPETPERIKMLLILAIAVVSVGGREALARGLEYVSRAESLVQSSDENPVNQVQCWKARVGCFYFAGEHAKAADAAETAVVHARSGGLRYEECVHLHNIGEAYLRLGERSRAHVALLSSNEIASDIGAERIYLHNRVLLAYLDSCTARVEEIADGFRAVNNSFHELHARYWLGRLLAAQDPPLARRELSRALDLALELKVRMIAEECTREISGLGSGA